MRNLSEHQNKIPPSITPREIREVFDRRWKETQSLSCVFNAYTPCPVVPDVPNALENGARAIALVNFYQDMQARGWAPEWEERQTACGTTRSLEEAAGSFAKRLDSINQSYKQREALVLDPETRKQVVAEIRKLLRSLEPAPLSHDQLIEVLGPHGEKLTGALQYELSRPTAALIYAMREVFLEGAAWRPLDPERLRVGIKSCEPDPFRLGAILQLYACLRRVRKRGRPHAPNLKQWFNAVLDLWEDLAGKNPKHQFKYAPRSSRSLTPKHTQGIMLERFLRLCAKNTSINISASDGRIRTLWNERRRRMSWVEKARRAKHTI